LCLQSVRISNFVLLTADDRNHIGAISRKAQRRVVSHTAFDIDELMDRVDRKLFTHITKPSHCLHHLLPSKTSAHCSYSLRKRQHCYQLPHIEYSQYKNSIINRCLFNFRWSLAYYNTIPYYTTYYYNLQPITAYHLIWHYRLLYMCIWHYRLYIFVYVYNF